MTRAERARSWSRRFRKFIRTRIASSISRRRCNFWSRRSFPRNAPTSASTWSRRRFSRRYRSAADFAAAEPAKLEKAIQSTGFFRNKAKSIRAAAAAIVQEHGGKVPQTMAELNALPGVGRKTANVVLGNAFQVDEGIVVDTHVTRLSQRLGLTKQMDPEKIEQRPDEARPARALDDLESLAHLARAPPLFCAETRLSELRGAAALPVRPALYPARRSARFRLSWFSSSMRSTQLRSFRRSVCAAVRTPSATFPGPRRSSFP